MSQQYKKLRLVQEGYETFTGLVGHFEFENGVSSHPLSESEQAMISAVFKTEEEVDVPADVEAPAKKQPRAPKKEPDEPTSDSTDTSSAAAQDSLQEKTDESKKQS